MACTRNAKGTWGQCSASWRVDALSLEEAEGNDGDWGGGW